MKEFEGRLKMPSREIESIWTKEVKFPKREQLKKDLKVDVAIIGAGIAGILTAMRLQEEGLKVVILEGYKTVSGQTQNTTAKITSQHGLIYDKLIQNFGTEKALLYARANEEAIEDYAQLVQNNNIECHFERYPAYLYSTDSEEDLEKELKAALKCSIAADFTTKTTLPFEVKGAIKFQNQAQFNPLELLKKISAPLEIYEHTLVKGIEDNIAVADFGKVKADAIVVTSHYPFINMPGYYFLRTHQERSYVIALSNATKMDGMYRDANKKGLSFRNYNDLLLFSGGDHRTGENKKGNKYETLRKLSTEYYKDAREEAFWSAQDCMTLDDVPYIGLYSDATPSLYVATGFNKWGMTTSMVASKIISDMILGKKNPYEEVFTPQRFKVNASMVSLLKETKHVASGIFLKKLKPATESLEAILTGEGGIVEVEGDKVGIYKDKDNEIYMVSIKCTHLGCQLEWNQDELTWDCPCHGSRYDYKGSLLDNPALMDLPAMEDLEHE
jgi:glycine/D-amino acid oxidase-like deaminating enzyme/nitrite reductase/ring-hydroxylating ferredoxin subunit